MVLLFTNNEDIATFSVIDWVIYFEERYFVLNNESGINDVVIGTNNFLLRVNGQEIESDKISSYWYRKECFFLANYSNALQKNKFYDYIKINESSEHAYIYENIYFILENKRRLGTAGSFINNKLNTLRQAQLLEIRIPDTFILSNRNEIHAKFSGFTTLITKTISDSFAYADDGEIIQSFVELLDEDIKPKYFPPSLIQTLIDVDYEIRSFFLIDRFYSMATIKKKSKIIDVRKLEDKQCRQVPYELPANFAEKLLQLMRSRCLDTASIDIIKATDGFFYLLEVNPRGIFDNVSFLCNYNIEMRIAQYLCKSQNEPRY